MSVTMFALRMEDAGFEKDKPKGAGRIYYGIRLLELGETKAKEEKAEVKNGDLFTGADAG
jgi:hypothetical protein